jgi:hypothetical protein
MAKNLSKRGPVHVLVRLAPALHRKVKIQAAMEGRPLSEIFRDALRNYLEARPG